MQEVKVESHATWITSSVLIVANPDTTPTTAPTGTRASREEQTFVPTKPRNPPMAAEAFLFHSQEPRIFQPAGCCWTTSLWLISSVIASF
jgi:hypothetical protein